MPKTNVQVPNRSGSRGYTLIEVMVAMALALIILGMTFTLLDQLYNVSDGAIAIADLNQNLRASVNLIARDLTIAGTEIPLGGIPLPGGGTSTLINRPGPGAHTFPATGFLTVLTPGYTYGPPFGTTRVVTTDEITIIGVKPSSQLDQYFLTAVTFTSSNAIITVNPLTNIGAGASLVKRGDLIMLSNPNGSALLTVSAVDSVANTITFTHLDAFDTLLLNQFPPQATTGTIAQMQSPGPPPTFLPKTFPSVTAYHLNMITYYLDTATPQKLMRQVGTAAAQQVALGINILQFTYDLADGTPNLPNPATPNQIRKVNLAVTARSDHPSRKSGLYYSDSIFTGLTIQNLAFMNKY